MRDIMTFRLLTRMLMAIVAGLGLLGLLLGAGLASASLTGQGQPAPPQPLTPLRAWSIAPDGAVYVLDAGTRIFELTPVSVTLKTHSEPLFPGAAADQPFFLLAGQNQIFAGSQESGQTLILSRMTFEPLATLQNAGPMALDPGRRLFLAPSRVQLEPGSFDTSLLIYNLSDPARPSNSLTFSCEAPQWVLTQPQERRLYVRTGSICSSPPHQRQRHLIYQLDTLSQTGAIPPEAVYGHASPLSLARQADRMAMAYNSLLDTKLLVFDRQGQELQRSVTWYGDQESRAVVDPDGRWIYWLLPPGLWTLRGEDLSLQHLRPLTETFSDMALSPDGRTLYLFSPAGIRTVTTADIQTPEIEPAGSFSPAWLPGHERQRLYPSPTFAEDKTLFLQQVTLAGEGSDVYRSTDSGQTWQPLPQIAYAGIESPRYRSIGPLSISPEFARDQTITALYDQDRILRSTDGGDTWQIWPAPLAFVSERDGNRELYVSALDGSTIKRITHHPAADENPAWSPAYARLAFQSYRNGNWDIFTARADCGDSQSETECDLKQLTDHPADDLLPAWSPDGRYIAFVSARDGNPEIYLMDTDGGRPRRLTNDPTGDWRPAWLPDSRRLVFTSSRGGNNDLYLLQFPLTATLTLTGTQAITRMVSGPADERDPAVSSDGRIFFLSDRNGRVGTYVFDPAQPERAPMAFTEPAIDEAHPSVYGQNILYVAAGPAGTSQLYRVDYAPGTLTRSVYIPISTASAWSGQPAATAPWWRPDPIQVSDWFSKLD